MAETYTYMEFQYASFTLEPYAKSNGTSTSLLKDIIAKLNEVDFPSSKREIDRFKDRKGSIKRRLVHISSPFEPLGKRCFGKIALIKNKAPVLWDGKDLIEEIEKPENKQFIELTNYVIHFSDGSDPVIMIEYNHEGPRLYDIEFYFRQIAKDFRIARSIGSSLHLDTKYDQLENELNNVLGVTVKLNAVNLEKTTKVSWFDALKNLRTNSGYKDVRLELFYQRTKDKAGKLEKNVRALDFARGILGWLKHSNTNIEYVDDLKMSYQVAGSEDVIELDFLKNKTTSVVKVLMFNETIFKSKDFKAAVGQEFNYYLSSGKTHVESPVIVKNAQVSQ